MDFLRQVNEECQLTTTTERQILVQGDEQLEKPPFPSLTNIPGFNLIERGLEDLDVRIGNALQLHAAPYILAGRNSFLIGPENSKAGKSLSYLIPVLTKLMNDSKAGNIPSGSGPLALIVCSTSETGQKLEENISRLMVNNEDFKMIFLEQNEWTNEKKPLARFLHGREYGRKYDVILATAGCAEEMVKLDVSYFNYDRLSFLIFDDSHILLKYKQKECQTIIEGFRTYIEKSGPRPCLHQTIFCGSQWTEEMEQCFLHLADLPVLIINSPVQVLNYCRFNIQVVKAPSSDDNGTFKEFKAILEKHPDVKRILVVANEMYILKELQKWCRKEKQKINVNLLGDGDAGGLDVSRAKWNWESEEIDRVIVLTTDLSVHELKISTASLLIHYELSVEPLRTFALRFSSMWGHARNLTKDGFSKPRHEVTSYVILGPNVPEEANIVTKLSQLGATISPTLLDSIKKAAKLVTDTKNLCQGFKCFGRCTEFDETKCSDRHYFIEKDFEEPPLLPRTAQIEVRIKTMITPNLYRAQIVRYGERDPVTKELIKITDCESEVLRRSEKLKEIVTRDFKKPSTYRPGTKIVVTIREKTENRYIYTRAEVMSVLTRNYAGFPASVLVNCVDIGENSTVNVVDDEFVFAIPPEMESLCNLSVDLILANTIPPLGELVFRLKHYTKAKEVIKNVVLDGDIALSIGNTIWVKRLVQRKKLDCGLMIEIWDLLKELHRKRIIVRDSHHLDKLYQLCEVAGFSCDIYKTTSVSTPNCRNDDGRVEEIEDDGRAEEIEDDGRAEEIEDDGRAEEIEDALLSEPQRKVDAVLTPWTEEEEESDDDMFNFDVPLEVLMQALGVAPRVQDTTTSDSFVEEIPQNDPPLTARQENSTDSQVSPSTNSDIATSGTAASSVAVSVKHPNVSWYQKDDIIILKVLVPDIKEYVWNLEDKSELHFKTVNPPGYGFDLKLARKVENDSVEIKNWGAYCQIKLTKRQKGSQWPALTKEKGLHWVRPDFTVLDEEEAEGSIESQAAEKLNYIHLQTRDDYEDMNEDSDLDVLDDGTDDLPDNILDS